MVVMRIRGAARLMVLVAMRKGASLPGWCAVRCRVKAESGHESIKNQLEDSQVKHLRVNTEICRCPRGMLGLHICPEKDVNCLKHECAIAVAVDFRKARVCLIAKLDRDRYSRQFCLRVNAEHAAVSSCIHGAWLLQ